MKKIYRLSCKESPSLDVFGMIETNSFFQLKNERVLKKSEKESFFRKLAFMNKV